MLLTNTTLKYKKTDGSWETINSTSCDISHVNSQNRETLNRVGSFTNETINAIEINFVRDDIEGLKTVKPGDEIELRYNDGAIELEGKFIVNDKRNTKKENETITYMVFGTLPGEEYKRSTQGGAGSEVTKQYVDDQDQAVLASATERLDEGKAELQAYVDAETTRAEGAEEALKNKVDEKIDLLGSVPGHTDLPYNLPYFFEASGDGEKLTITAKTISLDNKKTQGEYSLDVIGATTASAGLMTAEDKQKLGDSQSKVKYSETEPTGSKDGDIWMY